MKTAMSGTVPGGLPRDHGARAALDAPKASLRPRAAERTEFLVTADSSTERAATPGEDDPSCPRV